MINLIDKRDCVWNYVINSVCEYAGSKVRYSVEDSLWSDMGSSVYNSVRVSVGFCVALSLRNRLND